MWSTEYKKCSWWQSSAGHWGHCLGISCFTCYSCVSIIPCFVITTCKLLESNHRKQVSFTSKHSRIKRPTGKEIKPLNDASNYRQAQTPRISSWTSRNYTQGMQTYFCPSEPVLAFPSLSLNSQGLEFAINISRKIRTSVTATFFKCNCEGRLHHSPCFGHRSTETQWDGRMACQIITSMGYCVLCT